VSTQTVASRIVRWGRSTLLVGALGVLVAAGSVFVAPKSAQAYNVSCSWFSCTVSFTRWETHTIAVVGAAAAAARGVPWPIAVFVERFADWAVAHGYCLKITYRPSLMVINPALSVSPGYYRC
jgi:hypothetical protein